MKTTTLRLAHSVNRSHVRLAFLLITLACFALSPQARAVCQEGCDLSNANTFLGDDALLNKTTGVANTAEGQGERSDPRAETVTFRYKKELDSDGIPQFGLVAEQVEKVNPDLVARDEEGRPYTVRYDAVNAMLLNEFLKEHRKVESLEKAMAQQQNENAAMRAMLKEQAAQIQKVSVQLEANKPATQVVDNP